MEIGVDAVKPHAEEYGDGRISGRSLALDTGSNDSVPDEGFDGRMGKVKTWVC